jgi:hypothetical protein
MLVLNRVIKGMPNKASSLHFIPLFDHKCGNKLNLDQPQEWSSSSWDFVLGRLILKISLALCIDHGSS